MQLVDGIFKGSSIIRISVSAALFFGTALPASACFMPGPTDCLPPMPYVNSMPCAPGDPGIWCTNSDGNGCAYCRCDGQCYVKQCGNAGTGAPGAYCAGGPPPPGVNWADHVCGAGGANPSMLPSPTPTGLTWTTMQNPMAACCWNGWGDNLGANPGSGKLDCVEAIPGNDFLAFYNGGATAQVLQTAGLTYPNRLFLLDTQGKPVNGFYDSRGKRCPYRDRTSDATKKLTPAQQFAVSDWAVANLRTPTKAAVAGVATMPAYVEAGCCNVMLVAFERRCADNPSTAQVFRVEDASTVPTTIRCTAAEAMTAHFYLMDVCESDVKKRSRFRAVTSLPAATNVDYFQVRPFDIGTIIKKTYGTGVCPPGFVLDPGTSLCKIN